MTTIYFDQFAISGLSGKDVPKEWGRIREVLFSLKKQGKIRCCTSSETIFETSQREEKENSNRIAENYDFISNLLDNCYLHDMNLLICQQIAKSVKGIDSDPFTCVTHDFTSKKFNSNLKGIIHSEFDTIEIPPFPVEISKDKMKYLPNVFYNSRKIEFLKTVHLFQTKGLQRHSLYFDICEALAKHFDFANEDFGRLIDQIEYNDFVISPTLRIHNMLEPYIYFSEQDMKQKIAFKNDLFDIRRISSAIPYCDVVFADRKWKNRIIFLELDTQYKTLVFSFKQSDLAELEMLLLS